MKALWCHLFHARYHKQIRGHAFGYTNVWRCQQCGHTYPIHVSETTMSSIVNLACPCCGVHYRFSSGTLNPNLIIVWCANGHCKSKTSNLGAEGLTLDEAVNKLDKIIEDEMETWI